jgi:hypothetical protein
MPVARDCFSHRQSKLAGERGSPGNDVAEFVELFRFRSLSSRLRQFSNLLGQPRHGRCLPTSPVTLTEGALDEVLERVKGRRWRSHEGSLPKDGERCVADEVADETESPPRRAAIRWSGWRDLNPRPPRPERGALPSCATSRKQSRTESETVAATVGSSHRQIGRARVTERRSRPSSGSSSTRRRPVPGRRRSRQLRGPSSPCATGLGRAV